MDNKFPDLNLDGMIKLAQLEKLNQEQKKLKLEQEKIQQELQTKSKNKREKAFIIISQIFIGLAILTFYISYILVPTFKLESINNRLDLAEKREDIYKQQLKLNQAERNLKVNHKIMDSIKREKEIVSDSLKILNVSRDELISEERKRYQMIIENLNEDLKKYGNTIIVTTNNVTSLQDSIKKLDKILFNQNQILNDINLREKQIRVESKNIASGIERKTQFNFKTTSDEPISNAIIYFEGAIVGKTNNQGEIKFKTPELYSYSASDIKLFKNGIEYDLNGELIISGTEDGYRFTIVCSPK